MEENVDSPSGESILKALLFAGIALFRAGVLVDRPLSDVSTLIKTLQSHGSREAHKFADLTTIACEVIDESVQLLPTDHVAEVSLCGLMIRTKMSQITQCRHPLWAFKIFRISERI